MEQKTKELLKSLEKTGEEYWNISAEVGQFLNILIRERKYKTILEIGSSNGYSGIWIAEALSHQNGQLYTVESNKDRFDLAIKNFNKSGLSAHITPIHGHAPEAIPDEPKNFDMAFFDATKYEHMNYFKTLRVRVKKGGIIATDNVISHKKELSDYIKTLKTNPDWYSVELNIGTGLMISAKIS